MTTDESSQRARTSVCNAPFWRRSARTGVGVVVLASLLAATSPDETGLVSFPTRAG